MAENARAGNGKFVKRNAGESPTLGIIDTGDVGKTESVIDGKPIETIDPGAAAAERGANGDGDTGKRGRGRPRKNGSKENPQEKLAVEPGKIDLDSLNFTLFYAHSLIATVSKTPEFALSEEEAKTLSASAMNVMKHYNITASQKAIDWGNLLLTMTIVYGGKFHAINQRQKEQRAAAREEQAAGLQPFNLAS